MFNNSLLSDVKFVTTGSHNSATEIPAHRFVLSIGSPVFLAMFNGSMAESTLDVIVLPDCEYDALLELFRYMYSDEIIFSRNNVLQVLYLAEKYLIPSLVSKCYEYLRQIVEGSNVFCVLNHVLRCHQQDRLLIDRCWEIIDEQTQVAIQSDEFFTIERSLLEKLVQRDSLTVKEIELFRAVDKWALQQCERLGLVTNGATKRKLIGEGILSAIRFPVMGEEEFASVILASEVLVPHEVYDLVRHFFSTSSTPPRGFLTIKRTGGLKHCQRFGSVVKFGWRAYGADHEKEHALCLSVDEAIKMQGVRIFSCNSEQHVVTLMVKDVSTNTLLAKKTGTFYSQLFQYKSVGFYGISILFDEPVTLEKDTNYLVTSSLSGSSSWRGENALEYVHCSGITFRFNKVTNEQFPEILFTLE